MARKKRDYAAEYRRQKERAQAEGFKSERERKAAHRYKGDSMEVAKQRHNASERRRAKAREWSRKHSKQGNSEYRPGWSDERVDSYYDAYVEPVPDGDDKLDRLYAYLVDETDLVDPEEWESLYVGE